MSNGVKKKTDFQEFRNNEKSAYKFYIYIYIYALSKRIQSKMYEKNRKKIAKPGCLPKNPKNPKNTKKDKMPKRNKKKQDGRLY